MNTRQQRYVAYYRVSTQKQGASGLGLEAQQKAVQEFLQQHHGTVIAEFKEVESGKNDNRPEFNKAADYCSLANAVLLVAKLDRLSRDLHFVTSLQKRGIGFKLCDLPEIDNLTIHILAAMAEHEARMISQRTRVSMQVAKERGVQLGNPHLDLQRNFSVESANTSRTEAQRQWRTKVFKILDHLEQVEGLSSAKEIAEAMNQMGLTAHRGGAYSGAIISRLRSQRDREQP